MYVIIDATKIKQIMMAECMDREELAEKSGVSLNTIAHLFSGKFKRVQASSLHNIAGAMGVKKERLLACEEELQERRQEVLDVLAKNMKTVYLSEYTRKRLENELVNINKFLAFLTATPYAPV